MQILSDNLDCSLLMKEAGLKFGIVSYQMWIGLQCLQHINLLTTNPEEVNSSVPISSLFHYTQGRISLAESYRNKIFDRFEASVCVKTPSFECGLRSQFRWMRSFVRVNESLDQSPLYAIWMANEFNETASWIEKLKSFNFQRKDFVRQFRRPKLSLDIMPAYTNYSTESKSKNIKLDETTWKPPLLETTLKPHGRNYKLIKIMTTEKVARGYMDAGFHALLLRSQSYAENIFSDNSALKFKDKLPYFLEEGPLSRGIKFIKSNQDIKTFFQKRERRRIYDRVWTAIIWRVKQELDEYAIITNFGTILNRSTEGNEIFSEFADSLKWSSAADLMVVDKSNGGSVSLVYRGSKSTYLQGGPKL
ncbi:unnamed protein product [Haemonchus placei]|uniref:Phospholipase B-like n=1 Tax=Haemonchus placei TaxID=6290 RepID=A0A158QPU2_HAEPC|nr:unnamed protein product [Haemonchus placei]